MVATCASCLLSVVSLFVKRGTHAGCHLSLSRCPLSVAISLSLSDVSLTTSFCRLFVGSLWLLSLDLSPLFVVVSRLSAVISAVTR